MTAYKEVISILDESVGAVVAELCKHHLESKTLLIFCSDNGPAGPRGFAANANLRGKKGDLEEGGNREPFIASWPGVIPAGKISEEVAMTMDFLPTFAKLADAIIPSGHILDGMDMMPLLKGEAKAPERVRHWQHDEEWAVRKDSWKLLGNRAKPLALFNLADDIAEKNSLMESESTRTAEFLKSHAQWAKSIEAKHP